LVYLRHAEGRRFPFKLKPPTQGLCRVKDLEFADVELLGNFKRNDDVCTGDMVFEFETYFDLDVDNLRSDFSKQFLGDKYEMSDYDERSRCKTFS